MVSSRNGSFAFSSFVGLVRQTGAARITGLFALSACRAQPRSACRQPAPPAKLGTQRLSETAALPQRLQHRARCLGSTAPGFGSDRGGFRLGDIGLLAHNGAGGRALTGLVGSRSASVADARTNAGAARASRNAGHGLAVVAQAPGMTSRNAAGITLSLPGCMRWYWQPFLI